MLSSGFVIRDYESGFFCLEWFSTFPNLTSLNYVCLDPFKWTLLIPIWVSLNNDCSPSKLWIVYVVYYFDDAILKFLLLCPLLSSLVTAKSHNACAQAWVGVWTWARESVFHKHINLIKFVRASIESTSPKLELRAGVEGRTAWLCD